VTTIFQYFSERRANCTASAGAQIRVNPYFVDASRNTVGEQPEQPQARWSHSRAREHLLRRGCVAEPVLDALECAQDSKAECRAAQLRCSAGLLWRRAQKNYFYRDAEHREETIAVLLVMQRQHKGLSIRRREQIEMVAWDYFGRFLADLRSTPIWWRRAKFSSWRAAHERKIEDRVARNVVREMSIGENYEGNMTPFRSDISRFSRGTVVSIRAHEP